MSIFQYGETDRVSEHTTRPSFGQFDEGKNKQTETQNTKNITFLNRFDGLAWQKFFDDCITKQDKFVEFIYIFPGEQLLNHKA